jgi:hypothetical protein
MEGALVYTGRVVEVHDGRGGRSGRVSVRGARVVVAHDLVPEARPGGSVVRDEPDAAATRGG